MILSKGGVLGPALVAVVDLGHDIGVLQPLQGRGGPFAERVDNFDRVHLVDQGGKYGGLKSAAGADFEHLVSRLRVELLGHVSDDKRRRNRLPRADR